MHERRRLIGGHFGLFIVIPNLALTGDFAVGGRCLRRSSMTSGARHLVRLAIAWALRNYFSAWSSFCRK